MTKYAYIDRKRHLFNLMESRIDHWFSEIRYYPFGMVMPNRNWLAISAQEYRFGNNKQEQDSEIYGYGNSLSALHWIYGARLAHRWNVDPISNAFSSNYLTFRGNPISFVDYNGDKADWYKDTDDKLQFDPNVNSQSDLGDRGTYVGSYYNDINESEGNTYYRSDGSIYFENQRAAYNRIWENSLNKESGKVEQFAVGLSDGVLVTPDYKNALDESSPSLYNYELVTNQIYDPVTKEFYDVYFTMHSHIIGTVDDNGPSDYDIHTFGQNTPNTPSFIMALNSTSVIGFVADSKSWGYLELPSEISNLSTFLNSNIDLIKYSKEFKK